MPFFLWLPIIIWSGMCSVAQEEARRKHTREREEQAKPRQASHPH